jgi:hypothetical protein
MASTCHAHPAMIRAEQAASPTQASRGKNAINTGSKCNKIAVRMMQYGAGATCAQTSSAHVHGDAQWHQEQSNTLCAPYWRCMRWQASLPLPTETVDQIFMDHCPRWPHFFRLGDEVVQTLMKGRHVTFITVLTHVVTDDSNHAVVFAVQRRIASQGAEDKVNAIE